MPIRLLIADDHALFRRGIRVLLETEPEVEIVSEAGRGPETLALLAETEVDVLILDLSLPGIPGAQVAEAALRQRPDLPIVVLTMHEDEHYLREMFKLGVRAYVTKKSTATNLLDAIRAAFRGDRYIDPSLARHVLRGYLGRREPLWNRQQIAALTPREKEVFRLLAFGHTNAEIAGQLCISVRTVETHRKNLMAKLNLRTRAQLVRYAIAAGILKLDDGR